MTARRPAPKRPRKARRRSRRPPWHARAWAEAGRACRWVSERWSASPVWIKIALMMFVGAFLTSVCADCGDCWARHVCRAVLAVYDWATRAASAGVAM